ncbi:MAG: hypothetical protein JWM78_924 [Verrucomicrobiaceae bacterium]|nr:hypothetical protein [Verrucomicrobiaceae bacterium]
MKAAAIHCPRCNTSKVNGQGLVIYENSPLVQYRCRDCGELFFLPDQRTNELIRSEKKQGRD